MIEFDIRILRLVMRLTVSRHSRLVSSTLALSTDVTWPPPLLRRIEGDARHPLDFLHGIDAQIARRMRVAFLLAEIGAACELAHDEQIDALSTICGFSGECASVASVTLTGRRLANRPSALRIPSSPSSGLRLPPSHFGPPTAPRNTASAARTRINRAFGQRVAGCVDRSAADQFLGEFDIDIEQFGRRAHDVPGRRRNFPADTIAGQQYNLERAHAASLFSNFSIADRRVISQPMVSTPSSRQRRAKDSTLNVAT